MKFIRAVCLLLVLTVLFGCISLAVFAEDTAPEQADMTVTQGCHSVDATSAYLGPQQLTDNVATAIVYEVNSDTLMHAWHADDKVYPSSLVKIMTALLAVEKGDLQAIVMVEQDALDSVPYYAASADLEAGEEMTLSDLIHCMMVGSANDAAAVIADHISGSQTAFVEEMNTYARSLGCTATQFTNPHGLHDENQFTTTRDIARILVKAVKNADFLTYYNTDYYTVPATNRSEQRELATGNLLINTDDFDLYFDSRVKGGRTGVDEDGFRCLATVAEDKGMQIITVVTGSKSIFAEDGNTQHYGSFKETSVLLDACFTGYQVAQVLYEGQALKQLPVANGENEVVLASKESAYAVLPEAATAADLTYRYADKTELLSAPVEKGAVLSNVQVWHGGFCIAQADLSAMSMVRAVPVQTDDNSTGLNSSFVTALIIVFSIVGGLVLLLFLVRGIRYLPILLRNQRSKRYKRSRRRSR